MTTNDLQSYVNEIETQRQKPIEEQLNDLKLAGAKLLQALDNYIKETNNIQYNKEEEDDNLVVENSGKTYTFGGR